MKLIDYHLWLRKQAKENNWDNEFINKVMAYSSPILMFMEQQTPKNCAKCGGKDPLQKGVCFTCFQKDEAVLRLPELIWKKWFGQLGSNSLSGADQMAFYEIAQQEIRNALASCE